MLFLLLLFISLSLGAMEEVKVVRDARHTPHIFANTTIGAAYGLGRAHCEDRLYQMVFRRAMMGGRLSELLGVGVGNQWLNYDKQHRVFGFDLHVQGLATTGLDEFTRTVLSSYANGVNDCINARKAATGGALGTAFAEANIDVAAVWPWQASDSLLVYLYYQSFGDNNIIAEIKSEMTFNKAPSPASCVSCEQQFDDERDMATDPMPSSKKRRNKEEMKKRNLMNWFLSEDVSQPKLKASHSWSVAGWRRSDGKKAAICVSSPQMPIDAPTFWTVDHVQATFDGLDARGASIAGCPGHMVGWTRDVCYGASSAGQGELLDLFEITPSSVDPANAYVVDGQDEAFVKRTEVIKVKGGADVQLLVKSTRFGPIIDDLLDLHPQKASFINRNPSKLYAASHVVLRRNDSHDVLARLAMWRAKSLADIRAANYHTTVPRIHDIYGLKTGEITYLPSAAIPKRQGDEFSGMAPQNGAASSNDWQGFMIADEKPHAYNRSEGYSVSANGMGGSANWYDIYVGLLNPAGETDRGERVHQRLQALLPSASSRVSVDDVFSIIDDYEHSALVDFASIVQIMFSEPGVLDDVSMPPGSREGQAYQVARALTQLSSAGAKTNEYDAYFKLALEVLVEDHNNFRQGCGVAWRRLACEFGSGPHGRVRFLREAARGTAGESFNLTHDAVCLQRATEVACTSPNDYCAWTCRRGTSAQCSQPGTMIGECRQVAVGYIIDSLANGYDRATVTYGAPDEPAQWTSHPLPPPMLAFPRYQSDFFCYGKNSWPQAAAAPTCQHFPAYYGGAGYVDVALSATHMQGVLLDQFKPTTALTHGSLGTLASPMGAVYRFRVDLDNVDAAEEMQPFGVDEDPAHPSFNALIDDWRANTYTVTPLSKSLIVAIKEDVYSVEVPDEIFPPTTTTATTTGGEATTTATTMTTTTTAVVTDATPASVESPGGGFKIETEQLIIILAVAFVLVLCLVVCIAWQCRSSSSSSSSSALRSSRASRHSRHSRRSRSSRPSSSVMDRRSRNSGAFQPATMSEFKRIGSGGGV